ncbi:MAG: hypothetical protein P1P87_17460, partial [Trueperaceae bacterium]|nr:hypothetical protein [Trueperaceae bacterium]
AAAIVWHTVVDAVAVYLAQRVNVYAAELSVFGMALLAVAFIFWARRSGLIPLENPDDDLSGELRPGSSRLRNRAFEDRISEEIDQSRYL